MDAVILTLGVAKPQHNYLLTLMSLIGQTTGLTFDKNYAIIILEWGR